MLVSFFFIISLILKTAFIFCSAKLSIARPAIWSLKVMRFHNFHQTLRRPIWHLLQHLNRLQDLPRQVPVPFNIHAETIVERVEECLRKLRPYLNKVFVGLKEPRYLNLARDDLLFVLVSMDASFHSFLLLLLPRHRSLLFFKD